MKKIIKAFFKEIVPIIVGILIALYINNWNEDRKDKNYIDQISTSIQNELTESHKDIDKKLVQQKTLIDSLNFYLNDNQVALDEIINKARGIYIPKIRINSWKAISNSKIELMDYEKVSTLADIEEQKELLLMKAEKLIDFIYSNYKETGKDKKEFMIIMMSEVISTEKSLQEDIGEIIKE